MNPTESSGEINGKLISDSGYSNSCSNSHSQKSNSIASLHCGSISSGSSGYGVQLAPSNRKDEDSSFTRSKEKITNQQRATTPKNNCDNNPLVSEESNTKHNVRLSVLNDVTSYQRAAMAHTMDIEMSSSSSETDGKKSSADHHAQRANSLKMGEKQLAMSNSQKFQNKCDGFMSPGNGGIITRTGSNSERDIIGSPVFNVTASSIQRCTTYRWSAISKPELNTEATKQNDDFNCVVSMHNGIVVYITSLSNTSLGYPKDMWMGRAFIDFLHPKDRSMLTDHVAIGVTQPCFNNNASIKDADSYRTTMFCRFRCYRALQSSGYRVNRKATVYSTYTISMTFKNIVEADNKITYLIVHAKPTISAYSAPSEIITKTTRFMTQHSADGLVTHIDVEAVPYWGYLPQDILQKFILDCYHPDDLPYLKQVYETVVQTGCKFKSKPYRFLAQNGDYLLMDTDWSSFVNPWTRKLEFIFGHHRVLGGPSNCKIFEEAPEDYKRSFSSEIMMCCREIQKEILEIMNTEAPKETIKFHPEDKDNHQVKAFMESLVYECTRMDQELKIDIPPEDDPSFSERDSIMFGEISPHHDYSDSKSSTETPPSYNQLNYNDNLQRFFDSNPSTAIHNLLPTEACASLDLDLNIRHFQYEARKCMSPIQQGSGHESRRSGSSGMSNTQHLSMVDVISNTNDNNYDEGNHSDSSQFLQLTESILSKHNTEMEKIMFKKHREARSVSKAEEREKLIERRERKKDFMLRYNAVYNGQGGQMAAQENKVIQSYITTKRLSYQQWENNDSKMIKYMSSSKSQKPVNSKLNDVLQYGTNKGMKTVIPHNNSTTEQKAMSPLAGSPCLTYSPFTQHYMCTPVSTMANKLWPNGLCNPTTTYNRIQQPISERVFCLPQSNYQQALLDNEIIGDKKAPNKNTINSHSSTVRKFEYKGIKRPGNEHQSGTGVKQLRTELCNMTKNHQDTWRGIQNNKTPYSNSSNTIEPEDGDKSSFSSFYSSFLKTENESLCGSSEKAEKLVPHTQKGTLVSSVAVNANDNQVPPSTAADKKDTIEITATKEDILRHDHKRQMRASNPPWLDEVVVTSELIYRYQLNSKTVEETLKSDMMSLKTITQPTAVDDQLFQLYNDLQLEGFATRLTLEEGITSSSSSGEETQTKKKTMSRRNRECNKMMIIYEEDAPFPSPVVENDINMSR